MLRLETGEEAPQSRVCDSNQTKRFDVNAVWFTSAVTKLTQHDLGLALISCHHLPTYFKNALCHVGLHWYDIGSPTGHLCHNHCLQSHIWNKLKAEDKAVSAIANRRHLLATRYTVRVLMPKRGAGSANAKAAVAKGGVLVGQDVHDDILQEIAVRADLEGALE